MKVEELEALCAERPEITVERFNPNDFYGHAAVLKRYCGLPPEFILPGVHPHGPSISDFVWDYEVKHPLRNLLLVSESQRPFYAKICDKPATVIGSPLYYALRLIQAEVAALKANAAGTVVFPFHSTHHVTVEFNEDSFLKYLRELPPEWNPITVCMYWRDVQLGRHRRYIDAGFECASAGHIYDHEFLFRFIRLVSAHRRCITNELGTCVLYSAALDLPVTIFRQDYSLAGADSKMIEDASIRPNLPEANRFLEISQAPTFAQFAEQKKIAQEALGYESLWGASELRGFFERLALEENPPKRPRTFKDRVARELGRFKRRLGFV